MNTPKRIAPDGPGTPPTWTTGAKTGIGKAIEGGSNVSFTVSNGIVNEVYFPREDFACVRQTGLVITDGHEYFANERFDLHHSLALLGEGVPGYVLTNTCQERKFVITKEVITDPIRNVLLQKVTFQPEKTDKSRYQVYVVLEPHIRNSGGSNTCYRGDYNGVPYLYAQKEDLVLALACNVPWKKHTVGYKGASDGITDLAQNKRLTNEYDLAENGNIVLTAEVPFENCKDNSFIIAVGFGYSALEAAQQASAALLDSFETAKENYIQGWKEWQEKLHDERSDHKTVGKNFHISAAVLRVCESKTFPGAIIASLSIPWGNARNDENLGGYHLVWPRDLVETAWALLSMGSHGDVIRVINYLLSVQLANGSWTQNMWLEGEPYWHGVQMDQTALPVILIDACRNQNLLDAERIQRYWPGVKKAAAFILKEGPATGQDRWERQPGISPFTIAAEIAALLAAASFAELFGENDLAEYMVDTADCWNEQIEEWTYVQGTALATENEIDGYYIRINPAAVPINQAVDAMVNIKHHDDTEGDTPAKDVIAADALALVRFGLRAADDPRVLNTVKMIDRYLKVETPSGDCWHRFTKDAYGEDENGNPFKEKGKGRAWPLLTGERAHYEIAAGNIERAKELLQAMEAFSSYGMIPEQIWDTDSIPEKGLLKGQHTGSAMPLVWAHAEYLKLCNSIKHQRIVDLPARTLTRYVESKTVSRYTPWRFTMQSPATNKSLIRIEVMASATIRWTADEWETSNDMQTKDTGIGIYVADIPVVEKAGRIIFTFYWQDSGRWENQNFIILVNRNLRPF